MGIPTGPEAFAKHDTLSRNKPKKRSNLAFRPEFTGRETKHATELTIEFCIAPIVASAGIIVARNVTRWTSVLRSGFPANRIACTLAEKLSTSAPLKKQLVEPQEARFPGTCPKIAAGAVFSF
jgi:hypothetical protein